MQVRYEPSDYWKNTCYIIVYLPNDVHLCAMSGPSRRVLGSDSPPSERVHAVISYRRLAEYIFPF